MSLGEVIGKICEYLGANFEDTMKLMSSIYSIEVYNDKIVIFFVDANTPDLVIEV